MNNLLSQYIMDVYGRMLIQNDKLYILYYVSLSYS